MKEADINRIARAAEHFHAAIPHLEKAQTAVVDAQGRQVIVRALQYAAG